MLAPRHFSLRRFATLVVACLGFAVSAPAQDDEDSPYRPGLVATYTAAGNTVNRLDELLAFDWQDAACDPRLPRGEFTARWIGRLWARGSGAYRLHVYVCGEVSIQLAGKEIVIGHAQAPQWLGSQELPLEFDHHALEVSYRRTQPLGQIALFWSGPDFQLEPVPARALVHDKEQSPSADFERGRQLAAALRCGACHQGDSIPIQPAPALDRLSGNIHRDWIVSWLSEHGNAANATANASFRRMPLFGLEREQADALAAWLLREPPVDVTSVDPKPVKSTKSDKAKKSKKGDEKPTPSAAEGERLLLSRGCLACHQLGALGESGLFGGGDLTSILDKRPVGFLNRWLKDPEKINRTHRMPVFTLTTDEQESLRLWEQEQSKKRVAPKTEKTANDARRGLERKGEELVKAFRCASCHVVSRSSTDLLSPGNAALTAATNWSRSCAGELSRVSDQPAYRLSEIDRKALQSYYSAARPGESQLSPQFKGRDLLVQLNCLACHQREGIDRSVSALPAVLQDKLANVAAMHDDLAPLVPAMTPPALNSVGDKLRDDALVASISREGPPHRPYLLAQMPKFKLTTAQLESLTAYFVSTDRIPAGSASGKSPSTSQDASLPTPRLLAAGPRLVTTDGLACTSCHAVGSVQPAKAQLNARGPDLSMVGKRIRREWFDRWCADPARIVPRMEMPSVKIPVRGVLDENIRDQLAAVWHILNTPGFEPPEPNPVRVLRLSGIPEKNERPIVIHDVFKDGDKTYLYPLVIGLPNRHNILFDLETNRLAAWWLGDTARQRTKGKSWYWEMGAKPIFTMSGASELSLIVKGSEFFPTATDQFVAKLDLTQSSAAFQRVDVGAHLTIPTSPGTPPQIVSIAENFELPGLSPRSSFERRVAVLNTPPDSEVRLRLVGDDENSHGKWDATSQTFTAQGGRFWVKVNRAENLNWRGDGTITFSGGALAPGEQASVLAANQHVVQLTYGSALPNDQFLTEPPPQIHSQADALEIAAGFTAVRLPLPTELMPSALAFKSNGELAFTTLKGEVWTAKDATGDGMEESLTLVADGVATPYGLQPHPKQADDLLVGAKAGLLRLHLENESSDGTSASFSTVVASGWGHTDDYHDWAVGPAAANDGEYYIALPCQQDQRNDAAAEYRGRLIKLRSKKQVPGLVRNHFENVRAFDIEVISAGHRFPMGMARNRDGELFVTDNQGNYNPFNELNHVRKGAHFGFINALEKQNGFVPPPLSPPAINIPHPWTRSVNGICFLDTPEAMRKAGVESIYGPLEGHLVGCEYDTRRLIRMSLQRIGDTYQGAAYPLSIPPDDVDKGLLGPIVCAIKPTTGELYVGEIRDSGWGASNNIGQITKIKIEPEKLPCGIAEVRATNTGFTIDFFQPMDTAKALDTASYSIESYRRESTPAYGGPDLDRRSEVERLKSIELSPDKKRATLFFSELRSGHVYEFKVKNLTPSGGLFHPDEAHFTLHQIPQ